MGKAPSLPVDAVILDLEDGSGEEKAAARENVLAALTSGAFSPQPGPTFVVRVNSVDSPWFTGDVEVVAQAVACAGGAVLHAVCLPKVTSRADVSTLASALTDAGVPPGTLRLWAMIETPLGVVNAASIAASSSGGWDVEALPLDTLVAGTTDLATDLRVRALPGRAALLTSLSTIVLAARAHGMTCLDGVSLLVPGKGGEGGDDEASFALECEHGRSLGFDGKTLIHPLQAHAANGAFAPSAGEVDLARRVLCAWEGRREGDGVAVLHPEGRLVEALHVGEAVRVLGLALAAAERDGARGQAARGAA